MALFIAALAIWFVVRVVDVLLIVFIAVLLAFYFSSITDLLERRFGIARWLGLAIAVLVTGTFVTELIFGLPGMGKYFVTSITNRDYPVIMGTILLYALCLVFANLVVDLVYAWLDPRIRYT